MRPRFALLAILFIVLPIVEIYVLIQVGQVVGGWWTVLLLLLGGVVGSWLVRREGARAWRALQEALRRGAVPGLRHARAQAGGRRARDLRLRALPAEAEVYA